VTPRLAALALALAALLAGCGPPPPPPAAGTGAPSILLVVLDACRPDRLGCYGYELETSPALDELALDPDAVLFRRHYVQGTWTKSSTASLLTGLFAFQHGVLEGHKARNKGGPGLYTTQVLREDYETMAERLGRAGFRTFGAVKSYHLVEDYGFAQGFDEYHDPEAISSDQGRIEAMLRALGKAEGPFFAYVHLNACHHPYPPGFRHEGFMAEHDFGYDEDAALARGIDFTTSEAKRAILNGRIRLGPEDVRFLNLVYDAKLRRNDETTVRPLLRGLRDLGVYDDTMLIVTADHGEELYEHEGYAHGHALWEEVVRVPLVVKFPRGRRPEELPREVAALTQSIDLLPSLLAFSGAPVPEDLPGTDIFGGSPRGFAFSEMKKGGWMMVREGLKYIEEESGSYLFDLDSDPAERRNLAAELPGRAEDMRKAAEALRLHVVLGAREAPTAETELDAETREALRSLGYLE
jgi:arylsulfatase A-like enzyme